MPSSLQTDMLPKSASTKAASGVLSKEQLLDAYHSMLLIRRVEESLLQMSESGKIGGAMHTAIGHEANAVGAALALKKGDYITTTYRGHHHALAHGVDAGAAIAEVLGRVGGFAKGKGGSMHFIKPELGLMGANGIVGAQVPHAAGLALASKLRKEDHVAMAFFGEGANFQGVMHETFNISQKWSLPVIFYCENNRYSEMTPTYRTSSAEELYKFPRGAYGMESLQIDGNDVEAVYQTVLRAAERARAGDGPTYVEALTYRLAGHMAGDLETYRTPEEIAFQRQYEPLAVVLERLQDKGASKQELEKIRSDVEARVQAAVKFAEESPWPDVAETYTDVFAPDATGK